MNFFKASALLATAAVFFACGDDSSTSASQSDIAQENISSSSIDEISSSSIVSGNVENTSSSSTERTSIDDASSSSKTIDNDENSSSSETNSNKEQILNDTPYRVTRPVVYEKSENAEYFKYYWGLCKIDNGTYNFAYNTTPNMELENSYVIKDDTLKIYYTKDATHFDRVQGNFYLGQNKSLFEGQWIKSPNCKIKAGQIVCDDPDFEFTSTIEFTQDSIIWYMRANPEFKLNLDLDSLLQSDSNIKLISQNNSSYTVDIYNQIMEFSYLTYTEPNRMVSEFVVKSNNKKCSFKSYFSYVTAETCNEKYKDALHSDGYDEDTETTYQTYYVRDSEGEDEYVECFSELVKGNPFYNL